MLRYELAATMPAPGREQYIYGEGDRGEELARREQNRASAVSCMRHVAGLERVRRWHSKQQEVAEITLKGMRFRDWESVQVKLAEGESNNTFRLTVSEGKPLSSKFADMQIRPGDHCTITLAGELAITGYVETRQVAYTAEQHGIEIIGREPYQGAVDGAAMTKNGNEFRNKPWKQIADEMLKPAGIKVVPKTGLDEHAIPSAPAIPPGDEQIGFPRDARAPARHHHRAPIRRAT